MERIRDINSIDVPRGPFVDRPKWTAIVPAAGRGTRLGDSRPKILYPILNKPMVEWLAAILDPFVDRFIFILSPEGRTQAEPVLQKLLNTRVDIAIQPSPLGMADAVWQAKALVHTPCCAVAWGDQVALTQKTIAACMTAHASRANATLTFPTVWKKNPYIHFVRNQEGRLQRVYQAREEKEPLREGENDCGIFFFQSQKLFDVIETARAQQTAIGRQTGEFNLLPLLPLFDEQEGQVVTVRIQHPEESLGVNTAEEARQIETILKARRS